MKQASIEISDHQELFAELDSYIDGLETHEGALIAVLHKAQDLFGSLPKEVQNHVAHKLQIPSSKVYGVVTFYSFFNIEPKGQIRVDICMGTACFVRGAERILEEFQRELNLKSGETDENGLFSLDCLRCVGACGLAPVLSVNGRVYGRVTPDDVRTIVEEHMVEGSIV